MYKQFYDGLQATHLPLATLFLFIAVFTFGKDYFGWSDPAGYVQLSLVSCFVFGIICGIRVKS